MDYNSCLFLAHNSLGAERDKGLCLGTEQSAECRHVNKGEQVTNVKNENAGSCADLSSVRAGHRF